MWMKWLPWRFIVRRMARSQGFLDPFVILANLRRFSQPSEVMAPTELLRAGAVMQARGLMNSQAIQHNLDWIWPFWVMKQFDPKDAAFVPRAFNVTHINLTHRNWTAVGVPDSSEFPLIDPRGLVTPFFDGWSIDAWVLPAGGPPLYPSHASEAGQEMVMNGRLSVATKVHLGTTALSSRADVVHEAGRIVLRHHLEAFSPTGGWLVLSVRPYNPEGVSFIDEISISQDRPGFRVNRMDSVYLSEAPERYRFSRYKDGDVAQRLEATVDGPEAAAVKCDVGMATSAAMFRLSPGEKKEIGAIVPLGKKIEFHLSTGVSVPPPLSWEESLRGHCQLETPDPKFRFLYDAALRTLVLHTPGDAYPGPYTYKRFWFRDAAFILHGLLCAGLADRAERVIDRFPSRQTPFGYFLSQEGEWDSNGEALWTVRRYCELTGRPPKDAWKRSILRAGHWILRKRLPDLPPSPHAGLLPAGFSAEHLGPNDYYYWDDFWGVAGLEAAAFLANLYGENGEADKFRAGAADFSRALESSVGRAAVAHAVPASPYRRLDAGSIGSLAGGYPLKLWAGDDPRLAATAEFLMKKFFVQGGFFQEISHSGINQYLTLHVAQVLLRAGDRRCFDVLKSIADLASPTGQWPEAIHPRTGGGCMGDGQHVWAAAEWLLVVRNLFIREEEAENTLILCSGVPVAWAEAGCAFGRAPTTWGPVSVRVTPANGSVKVSWEAEWRGAAPRVSIRLLGYGQASVEGARGEVALDRSPERVPR